MHKEKETCEWGIDTPVGKVSTIDESGEPLRNYDLFDIQICGRKITGFADGGRYYISPENALEQPIHWMVPVGSWRGDTRKEVKLDFVTRDGALEWLREKGAKKVTRSDAMELIELGTWVPARLDGLCKSNMQ